MTRSMGYGRKISVKAKIIFCLIPLIILISIEIFARFFESVESILYPKETNTHTEDIKSDVRPWGPKGIGNPINYEEDMLLKNFDLNSEPLLQQKIHIKDKDSFYRLNPNESFTFKIPGSYIVNYKINSHGFRGDEFEYKKSPRTKRIVCIGDSSTFGFFVNNFDTYPKRLNNILQTQTVEKNAEVINGGILAYSSFQGIKFFEESVRPLKPDILVMAYGFNDSYENQTKDNRIELETESTSKIKRCLENFATYRLLSQLSRKVTKNDDSSKDPGVRVDLSDYKQNLEKIYSICQEDNIYLILLPISAPVKYQEVMRELAKEKGCSFVNMESIFQNYHKKFLYEGPTSYKGIKFGRIRKRAFENYHLNQFGSREMVEMRRFNYLFMDYCHPSPVGYQIIAEALYDKLLEKGFFTRMDGTEMIINSPDNIKNYSPKPLVLPVLTK
jgi:lysophospholipase L1-like esterase